MHPSKNWELAIVTRLEYLGDSVLDLLITWHLYQSYTDIDPGLLLCQLTEYVKSISESHTDGSLQGPKGPEALGDMVESIARAILLDTKLILNEVWRIYKPLLSPIVTPDKLELHPFRKLKELCASRGYFIKETFIKKGDMVHAELSLQLKDVLLIGEGYEGEKKLQEEKQLVTYLKNLRKEELYSPEVLPNREIWMRTILTIQLLHTRKLMYVIN